MTGATLNVVVAEMPDQLVVTGTAVDRIISTLTEYSIVAIATVDQIIPSHSIFIVKSSHGSNHVIERCGVFSPLVEGVRLQSPRYHSVVTEDHIRIVSAFDRVTRINTVRHVVTASDIVFAIIAWEKPHLLLLDEPTNPLGMSLSSSFDGKPER